MDNRGNLEDMKTVVYATLYHSISADENPQHRKCPSGLESWCFFQRAMADGKKLGSHRDNIGTHLKKEYLPKIIPVYQRLASNALLGRCLMYQTQNANESLHSFIWRHSPKDSYGSKRRVDIAVGEAICKFNSSSVRAAGLSLEQNTVELGIRRDRNHVMKSKLRATKYQHYRQAITVAKLRLLEACKLKEGTTYQAGHF